MTIDAQAGFIVTIYRVRTSRCALLSRLARGVLDAMIDCGPIRPFAFQFMPIDFKVPKAIRADRFNGNTAFAHFMRKLTVRTIDGSLVMTAHGVQFSAILFVIVKRVHFAPLSCSSVCVFMFDLVRCSGAICYNRRGSQYRSSTDPVCTCQCSAMLPRLRRNENIKSQNNGWPVPTRLAIRHVQSVQLRREPSRVAPYSRMGIALARWLLALVRRQLAAIRTLRQSNP